MLRNIKSAASAHDAVISQAITYPADIVVIPLSKQKGDFDQVNFVATA
ncbi:MAG: hypothetical protein ACAI44_40515 [Candidatus Sericytochromatia bacterium]